MTALLILDLLEDFFDPAIWPSSELPARRKELAGAAHAVVNAFRARGRPVLWIRQEFEPDLSDAPPHIRDRERRYTVKGTPGAAILSELRPGPDEPVLVKKRFSAFFQTPLDATLRAWGVDTVMLAGITTAWCVRATDAYQLGYRVQLLPEAIAGFTMADHQRALSEMTAWIATLVPLRDLGIKPGLSSRLPSA